MFIYFALPMLIEVTTGLKGIRFNAITAAVITIIINAGAYMAEIVRGSVQSVNKGLVEAGMAMGISRFQLITSVIGPIAFKRAIPPLGNQFIISLKDTSLFIVIGVGELTRQGQEIMPDLAESWEYEDDRILIFHLRPGVMWHDDNGSRPEPPRCNQLSLGRPFYVPGQHQLGVLAHPAVYRHRCRRAHPPGARDHGQQLQSLGNLVGGGCLLPDHDFRPGPDSQVRRAEDENRMSALIEFKDVGKSFGDVEVLHNIDLTITQGEVVVLVGPSGSGKSTLLRCINGLEMVTSGTLIVDGIHLPQQRRRIREVRQEVGMVFQLFYLFPHMSALDNVAFGPRKVRHMSRQAAYDIANDLLKKVGLADRSHHFPSELSGGQQQRVAIARALAINPKIMLFDEPTSALDPELREEVLNVMIDVAQQGITMVVVTHEMSFASKAGSRLLFMDDGRIGEDGDPQALLRNPTSERLKNFLQHVGY